MLADKDAGTDIAGTSVVSPPGLPTGIRRSSTFFPELESLRGIAILMVFFHHIDAFVLPQFYGASIKVPFLLWAFVVEGNSGVSLFFVLSAFLLSLPFLKQAAGGKRQSLVQFYKRRALRILPLYYAAVVFGSLFTTRQPPDLSNAIPYLVFLNSFVGYTVSLAPYSDVWWSLAAEVQFYLLLPLLPLFLSSRPGRVLGVGALVVFVYYYTAFVLQLLVGSFEEQLALAISVFGRAPAFLLGIVAASIVLRSGDRIRERLAANVWVRNGGADVAFLATWTAMALLLRWVAGYGYWKAEGQALHVWHILEGLLWAAIVVQLLLSPLRLKTLFVNPALSRLGTLSYSIYILHVPLIVLTLQFLRGHFPSALAGWNGATLLAVAGMSAACLVLSELTYRVIERPFLVRKAGLEG